MSSSICCNSALSITSLDFYLYNLRSIPILFTNFLGGLFEFVTPFFGIFLTTITTAFFYAFYYYGLQRLEELSFFS